VQLVLLVLWRRSEEAPAWLWCWEIDRWGTERVVCFRLFVTRGAVQMLLMCG
jgi:hypothetical protein